MKKLLVFSLVFALGAGVILPQFSYALTTTKKLDGGVTLDVNVKPNIVITDDNFEITNDAWENSNASQKPQVSAEGQIIEGERETSFSLSGAKDGDFWAVGEKHTIKWKSFGFPVGTIHKIVALNYNTNAVSEVKAVSGKKGKFIWTVPKNLPSGMYAIKGPSGPLLQVYIYNGPSMLGNPDINGDKRVNVNDLRIVLNTWGNCPTTPNAGCRSDISGPSARPDGTVNQYDLDAVIDNWTGEDSVVPTITGSGGISVGGGSPSERPTSVKPVLERPTLERPTLRPQTSFTKPLLLRPQILPVRPQGTVPPVTERPQVQPADRPEIVSQADRPQTDRPQTDRPTITTNVSTEVRINADVTGDGRVNVNDLLAVLNAWGKCKSASCRADINGDHVVNGTDLALVLRNWSR